MVDSLAVRVLASVTPSFTGAGAATCMARGEERSPTCGARGAPLMENAIAAVTNDASMILSCAVGPSGKRGL